MRRFFFCFSRKFSGKGQEGVAFKNPKERGGIIMKLEKHFKELVERWPSAFVSRTEVRKFSGGALTSKSLANHRFIGSRCGGTFPSGAQDLLPGGSPGAVDAKPIGGMPQEGGKFFT